MKFIENQSVINKLLIFEWNENSLCDYLSSNSRDTITRHPTLETLFLQISTFFEIRDLTYMEKSLTQDSMHRQDLLFEKAAIIFQTSWNIGVSGVYDWISQTRNAFWTVHSPAYLSYKFAYLLYCISHLLDLTLSSILLILL